MGFFYELIIYKCSVGFPRAYIMCNASQLTSLFYIIPYLVVTNASLWRTPVCLPRILNRATKQNEPLPHPLAVPSPRCSSARGRC